MVIACQSDGTEAALMPTAKGPDHQVCLTLRAATSEDLTEPAIPLPLLAGAPLIKLGNLRVEAAIDLLTQIGGNTQTVLFTHHEHITGMAERRNVRGAQVCRTSAA